MKTLILIATLLMGLSANASSIVVAQESSLYHISGIETPFGEKYVSGSLHLNHLKDEVKLTLVGENPCPQGAFCVRGPHFERITLPLVERDHLACGQDIYVASRDNRPADGFLVEVTITDFTHLICRFRPMAPTVVKLKKAFYDRINGKEVIEEALILGTKLKVVSPL